MLAFKTKLTIWIILDNGNPVAVRQVNQLQPPFQRHGNTGWILEIWQDVYKFWSGAQCFFQCICPHSIVVGFHRDIFRPVGVPGLQGAQVGGSFHQDAVTAVDEDFTQQVQCLLGAGCDLYVFGGNSDPHGIGVPGDHFPEGFISFR